MRSIILVTQWFPPEHAPIGHMILELAKGLANTGWDVTVVTGFPNHPSGVIFDGYRKAWFKEEWIDGIRVRRVFLYTSPKRTRVSRVLTFSTFTLTSAWAILRRGRTDIIFAVLQPLSVGLILPALAKLKRAKLVFNIQDLHPDVPIRLGLVKSPVMIRFLRWLEAYSYRMADGLTVISKRFREHCIRRGALEDRTQVIENWIDLEEIKPKSRVNVFRTEIGCSNSEFIVLYAGTIGMVSGAEVMVDVASILRNVPDIKIVFVGEGPLLTTIKAQVQKHGLSNMVFAPFQPREKLADVQSIADVSIVTLKKGAGESSVPSKVLGYMAVAKPVVAAVESESETAQFIQKAQAGIVKQAEDAEGIAEAILYLKTHPKAAETFGRNGREYLEQELSKEIIIEKYAQALQRVMAR